MAVIDVDTHWEVDHFAPDEDPLGPWRDDLPSDMVDRLAQAIAGDLLESLPDEERPDGATLLPSLVALARARGDDVQLHPRHASSPAERLAWMDAIGIDHSLVNPGAYWQLLEHLGPDRPLGVRRCNDFLAEQLADGADRLHGVAVLDFTDLRGAARELERMRAHGFRAFFLRTEGGRPPNEVAFGHPDWDVVWSAATDLGMVASVHVGNLHPSFDGWGRIGWDRDGGAGPAALTRLANTQNIHMAQDILASMLYGGVFHRHPELTVVLEEVRIGWLPAWVTMMSRQSMSNPALGEWPFPVSGAEMVRRNIKATPLPGFGDTEALEVVAELPEMCLWSSDYPHQEGNADPINLYGEPLQAMPAGLRDAFLGANAAEAFGRTGDPLP
jgi:predicted TIM-barrel fold metal-dependent hydrolase